MDNNVYSAPLEIIDSNVIGVSGNVLSSTLFSFLQSSPHDLNNQNHIMAGFPTLPVMQGEILDELHGGHQLTNHSGFATSNAMVSRSSQLDIIVTGDTLVGKPSPPSNEIEGRFMAGMPISAGRYGHHGNLNDIESLGYSGHQREVPEMLASNEYGDIVQSSYGTSVDYTYDAMFGNVNCKWDSLKFSAQFTGTVPQRTGFEAYQNMDHSRWISPENNNISSDNTSGSSKYSNELSLSLSTSQPGTICGTTIMERCSGISGAVISSESFHGKQFGMEQTSYNNKSHSSSYGKKPVQLSELLSGSRFLNEMQQILAEIARYSLGNSNHLSYPTSRAVAEENSFSFNLSSEKGKTVIGPVGNGHLSSEQKAAAKKHLLDLLQTVDNRYKQSLDEIHKVISAFHAVTELDPQIHARFALQTISLLYKSLRERISNYILSIGAHMNEGDRPEEEMSFETSFIQKQWALQQLRQKDHQFWRPQRGLPERSVSVLRAWMFQNFLHPYPKDADKHLLAIKSGLTRSQVSNWFINARVRLWKPMIDEMYSEMNRRKACRNGEETNSQHRSHLNLSNQRFRTI